MNIHRYLNPDWVSSRRKFLHRCTACGWHFVRRADHQSRCPKCGKGGCLDPVDRGYHRRAEIAQARKALYDMPILDEIVLPWTGKVGEKRLRDVVNDVSLKTGQKYKCFETLRGLIVRRVA